MLRLVLSGLVCLLMFLCVLILSTRLAKSQFGQEISLAAVIDPSATLVAARERVDEALSSNSLRNVSSNERALLFRGAPISSDAFVVEMFNARFERDLGSSAQFATHVLRRNPRHEAAHYILAEAAFVQNDAERALQALSRLIDLDRSGSKEYIASIGAIISLENGKEALISALAEEPLWGARLANLLAQTSDDDAFIENVLTAYPNAQNRYIQAKWRRGDRAAAHNLFLDFTDPTQIGKIQVPYDHRFEGWPGAQPFNWTVARKFAEIDARDGLAVSFFGTGRPVIASQVFFLSSGNYEIQVLMNGELHQNGGSLSWSVTCVDAKAPLLKIDVNELLASDTVFGGSFEVPDANCPFQRLDLNGVAGEFPRTARANVREVRIKAGSRS